MSQLRASQIETLEWLRLHAGTDGVEPAVLARALGISPWSAWRRLDRLRAANCVERIKIETRYRLTNKGRTALEEAENG